MPRSVYIGSVGGGGAPEGFSNATRYTDAADLASNGPAATGSGSFVLVDDGEAGRPRVYRDGGSWSPVNDAAAYASYAAAKADIANIGAGDYVVTPVGMYFVAASGSDRYLLPALPYGPGNGLVTAATRISLWEATGDNTDFGDFSKDTDTGTTSITDDGTTVTITAGGASAAGYLTLSDAPSTSADDHIAVLCNDLQITDLDPAYGQFAVYTTVYVSASEHQFSRIEAQPVSTADNWEFVVADATDATQTVDTGIAYPDGGTGADVCVTISSLSDRLTAVHSSDDGLAAVADLNAGARLLSTSQTRTAASASPYCALLLLYNQDITGVVTVQFSSLSSWRLTLS